MGAWSVDVLGGDTPMDMLSVLEEVLVEANEEGGMYPLDFSADEILRIRPKLEDPQMVDGMLTAIDDMSDDGDALIAYTVMGALYLTTGAEIPDGVRDAAASAADALAKDAEADGWNDPKERQDYMTNLAAQFRAHVAGQITDIGHVGLFAKLNEHLAAGRSGPINTKS